MDADYALLQASARGDVAAVSRLLAADPAADVHAYRDKPLRAASAHGHAAVVELLLAAGADVHAQRDGALCGACANGHAAVAARLLAHGANPYAQSSTPWRAASANGHLEVVRDLLDRGGGVNKPWVIQEILCLAVEHGHAALVLHLVAERGADVNALLKPAGAYYASTALELAVERGHLDVVRALVDAGGADVPAVANAALVEACWRGRLDMVRLLLERGAADACVPRAIERAYLHGHLEVADLLVAHGAPVPADITRHFISVCEDGHVAVAERLLALGADLNEDGSEALEFASRNGHLGIVQLLLQNGVDELEDDTRYEAIFKAATNGHLRVARTLVAHMVDWLAARGNKSDDERRDDAWWTLQWAARIESRAVVKRLLEEENVIAAEPDNVLFDACEYGNLSVVELLLEKGARVNNEDYQAFHIACERGHVAVVDLLIPQIIPDTTPSTLDRINRAMLAASENGHVEVVARCLQIGANVHAEQDEALRLACSGGHAGVVQLLLAHGADVHSQNDSIASTYNDDGYGHVAELLLAHGANVACYSWRVTAEAERRLVQYVPRAAFHTLPDRVWPVWMRYHVRQRGRLRRALQRARDRLDRPPTSMLGTDDPSRQELIVHLLTAGRRFAREYWSEGAPLFFRERDFGSLPECFQFQFKEKRVMGDIERSGTYL